jgi:hypothetical protein
MAKKTGNLTQVWLPTELVDEAKKIGREMGTSRGKILGMAITNGLPNVRKAMAILAVR